MVAAAANDVSIISVFLDRKKAAGKMTIPLDHRENESIFNFGWS